MLSTGQVAEILGISPQTVRRLVNRGELNANRITPTSPRQIPEEELRRFIRERNLTVAWDGTRTERK
jgi:excisionase family DNA binding protein